MLEEELQYSKDNYEADKESKEIPKTNDSDGIVKPTNKRTAVDYDIKKKKNLSTNKAELDKAIAKLANALAPKSLTPDNKDIKRSRDLSGRMYSDKLDLLKQKNIDLLKNSGANSVEIKLEQNRERMNTLSAIRQDENTTRMYGSLLRTENFNKNITSIYYRKSLEYGLSHLNTSKLILKSIERGFDRMESALTHIVKNSGLPDYVKMKNIEHIATTAKARMANKIVDVVDNGEVGDSIKEKVSSKSKLNFKGLGNMNAIALALLTTQLGKTTRGKKLMDEVSSGVSNPSGSLRKLSASMNKDVPDGLMATMKSRLGSGFNKIADLLGTDEVETKIGSLSKSKLSAEAKFTKRDILAMSVETPRLLSKMLSELTMIRKNDGVEVEDLRYDYTTRELSTLSSMKNTVTSSMKSMYSKSNFTGGITELSRMIAVNSKIGFTRNDILDIRAGLTSYMLQNNKFDPKKLDGDFYGLFTPRASDIVRLGIASIVANGNESTSMLISAYYTSRMEIPDIDEFVESQIGYGNLDALKKDGIVKTNSSGEMYIDRDRVKEDLIGSLGKTGTPTISRTLNRKVTHTINRNESNRLKANIRTKIPKVEVDSIIENVKGKMPDVDLSKLRSELSKPLNEVDFDTIKNKYKGLIPNIDFNDLISRGRERLSNGLNTISSNISSRVGSVNVVSSINNVRDRVSPTLNTIKGKFSDGMGIVGEGLDRVRFNMPKGYGNITKDSMINSLMSAKETAIDSISRSTDSTTSIIKSTVESIIEKLDVRQYIDGDITFKDMMNVWSISEGVNSGRELKTKVMIYFHQAGKVSDDALRSSLSHLRDLGLTAKAKTSELVSDIDTDIILEVMKTRKNNKELDSELATVEEKMEKKEDSRIESIVTSVLEKFKFGKPNAVNDTDGDGLRDGSWESRVKNKDNKSSSIGVRGIAEKIPTPKGPLGMILKILGMGVPILLKYMKGVFDATKALWGIAKPAGKLLWSIGKGIMGGISGLTGVLKGGFGLLMKAVTGGAGLIGGLGKGIFKGGKSLLGGGLTAAKKVAGSGWLKTLGKGALKRLPGVGLVMGTMAAGSELMKGNFGMAAGEFASGVASTVPGLGTAASLGIDAYLSGKRSEETDPTTNETESINVEDKEFVESQEQEPIIDKQQDIKKEVIDTTPPKTGMKTPPAPVGESNEAKLKRQKQTLEKMRSDYQSLLDGLKNKPNPAKRRMYTVMLDAIENKLAVVNSGELVEDFNGIRYDSNTGRAVFYKSASTSVKIDTKGNTNKDTLNRIPLKSVDSDNIPENILRKKTSDNTSQVDKPSTGNESSDTVLIADKTLYKETGKIANLSSIETKLVSHIRKSETGTSSGDYSIAKDIGDRAGISFGAYQFTEKSGNLKEYISRLVALTNDPTGAIILKRFSGNYYQGDKKELVKYLNDTGGTASGRYIQDTMYRELFLDPAKKLAMTYGVTDATSVAHVVDHYLNAGPGGAKKMLYMAAGDYTPDNISRARKQHYNSLIHNNYNLSKFRKGWLNRVDSLSSEFSDVKGDKVDFDRINNDSEVTEVKNNNTVNDDIVNNTEKLVSKNQPVTKEDKVNNSSVKNDVFKVDNSNSPNITKENNAKASVTVDLSGLERLMTDTNNSLGGIGRNTKEMSDKQGQMVLTLEIIAKLLADGKKIDLPKNDNSSRPRTSMPTGINLDRGTTL